MVDRAILAARDWAAEHRHEQPDDRMLRVALAVALHELADELDREPGIAIWPSTIADQIRDRADAIEPDPRPRHPGRD